MKNVLNQVTATAPQSLRIRPEYIASKAIVWSILNISISVQCVIIDS